MSVGEVMSSVISGVSVLLLAWIARSIIGVRKDARRYLAEHTWLLATTLWTRDKVLQIMDHMDMPVNGEPPADLPRHQSRLPGLSQTARVDSYPHK